MKNKIYNLSLNFLLSISMIVMAGSSYAQVLISPTGDGGFENGSTFAANGWTEVNGTLGLNNNWFVGSTATPSAGTNSAYISNDAAGATYNYNVSQVSTVHFYRDVTFPAGQTVFTLTFKWKCQGEGNYDYVTCYSMPTTNTPVANSPTGAFQSWLNIPTAYPGAVVHANPQNLNIQGGYVTQTICLPSSYAGTTRRLVFMFSNDPSLGTNPPGSIDEISLVASGPPASPNAQPTNLVLTPTTNSVMGSFTAAAGAPSGYLVVRTSSAVPPSAPVDNTSYTPGTSALGGVIVSSGSGTTFTATGLTPNTQYYFWVYSYNGSACAGPLYYTPSPLSGNTTTLDCNVTGTKTVGPTGNYATLTAAIADINSNGLGGPVILELQSTYLSSAEPAFPVVIPEFLCASPTRTLTIRPEAGAVGLAITSANATGTISINGGDYVIIDGRAGGTGPSQLTISNTSVTGYALQYINGATNNTVRYCSLQGVNTSTTNGVVWFSTTTAAVGNSYNTIDNCNISDGATQPFNCIYSAGTTTNFSQYNSFNTVSNSNIFNFYSAASASYGIFLTTGNTNWTINANSFYQTAARSIAAQFSAINITATLGNAFLVTNNYIGGSAPLCAGGAMTLTNAGNLRCVNMTVSGVTSTVSNNTVQNINFTTTNATQFNGCLLLGQGSFMCNGNTVGSQTANSNIVVSMSGSGAAFNGIIFGGSSPTLLSTISNNTVGGIDFIVTGAPATIPFIRGISVQGTTVGHNYIVTNNTVGSPTVLNSINSNSNAAGSVIGIVSFSNALDQQITNNTVANLTATNTGTANVMWGILAQGTSNVGTFQVTGNTVRNLTSTSGATGSGGAASIMGFSSIVNLSTLGTNNISNNTFHSFLNNNTTAAASVTGMNISHPAGVTTNFVQRNNIHSLELTSTVFTGIITGIQMNAGTSNVYNNMIRLGLNAAGADINNGYGIFGIREAAGNNNINFNSVYVGGAAVATGASNTFALSSIVTTGVRNYFNNILFNARSNSGSTGKHYAIQIGGTAPNPASVGSNYNDLFVTGTGGFVGLYNAVDQTAIANWRTATGLDFQSVSGDPKFILPNGTSVTGDLHIQAASPTVIEAAGQPIALVTQDFDAQVRNGLTPTDIGADAGNFLLLDVAPPGIGFTPLTGACGTGNLILTGVNITDGTGIPLMGGTIPRIYYRKGAGSWFSNAGTFVSGTATNSNWNFTINVADMGGVVATDVVSYYVIAQDLVATPNVGSNFGGVVATDVNTVSVHPVTPNTVTIQASLSGTYTVGAAGAYPTLTAAVAAYNTSCINGPITFSLIDPTYPSETFPITINQIFGQSSTNTLTIKPAPGVSPTISGSSASCIIRLNGADWVTIDGSNTVGGTSRDLTITNTSTATNTAGICVQSLGATLGATNDVIKNCKINAGSNTVTSTFGIHVAGTTVSTSATGEDNDNLVLQNNEITTAYYGIYARAASIGGSNDGLQIVDNLIGSATAANYIGFRGMDVQYANAPLISRNTVFNMIWPAATTTIAGIDLGSGVINGIITRNNVRSIQNTTTSGWGAYGIVQSSTTATIGNLIANNFVSDLLGANYSAGTTFHAQGIRLAGGNNTKVYNNSVNLFGPVTNGTTASASHAFIITSSAVTGTELKNNILVNSQNFTAAGSNAYSAYLVTGATLVNSNNNAFYGLTTGTTTYNVGFTGSVQTFLNNWQAATGQDGMSLVVQPNFASPIDLHLQTTGNDCLNQAGMPVTGVTDDYDGMVRDAVKPDIGADEFTPATSPAITVAENSGVPNDGSICLGASATITASGGTNYLWSPGGATTPAITVAPTMTTIYSVTISLAGGCTRVLTQQITVNPLPTTSITPSNPTISCSQSVTLMASGTGTFLWAPGGQTTQSITVSPLVTTPYSVTLTNSNGCTATASTTVTVTPSPTISHSLVLPSTCVSFDGSITLTLSGAPGPYTFNWTTVGGGGLINGNQNQSGLKAGSYFVTVTAAGGCTNTKVITLDLTPSCNACPDIGSLTSNVTNSCKQTNFTLTAAGLVGMGSTYGITFKYSATMLANPYSGGTVIGTVPNSGLTLGGTQAVLSTANIPTAGSYFIYAILSPTPGDPTCIPFKSTTVGIQNCTPTITDPCSCKNNATTLVNGQFNETIVVNAPAGQTWTVSAVNGLFSTASPAPPLAPIAIPVGFALTAGPVLADGSVNYTLMGIHVDAIGYTVTVTNGILPQTIGATCYYPNPTINGLAAAYCANSPNVTLSGSATLGGPPGGPATGSGTFTVNGIPNTIFSPSTLGAGTHTVVYTFDAADGVPNGSHPGCIQSVSQSVLVNPIPTVTNPGNKVYCSGVATGGITFAGTATSYNWTNTNTLIGLAASGTASPTIPSWTPINNTTLPIVGTITVTPVYTAGGVTCTGTPITFTITVNPAPKAMCKNFSLNLNAMGNATLLPANVDNGSIFLGGTLTVSPSSFTCGNIGANNVTLTATDACGQTSTCVAVVTVADNIPPTLVCPGNINIILDPGECDKGVFFPAPYATDNCEVAITTGMITSTYNSNNEFAGNMFNVTNNTTSPITINSFDGNINATVGTAVSFQVFYTTTASTYVGAESNPAAWTLLGSANSVAAGINLPTPVPIGGLTLMPGQTKGIYFVLSSYGITPGSLRYTNNNNVYTNGDLTITTGIGKGNPNFTGTNFLARSWNGTIRYSKVIGAPPVVVQTDNTGYKNGSVFPLGTTCLTYKATDFAGNTSTCQVCVKIEEYPNPKVALSCNDEIQVSLDGKCEAIIGADDLLEGGPYKCYNNYLVQIFKDNKLLAGSPKVTGANIGQVLTGKVTDPATGNSCWSNITVEDKLPPVLNCTDNIINCEDSVEPGTVSFIKQNFESPVTPIVDAATTTIAINVTGAPNPALVQNLDLNVLLDVQHTWIGDIDATLISPSGATVQLFDRPGVPATALGCQENNIYALFDDQATLTATDFENTCNASGSATTYAIKGTYKPITALINMTNTTNLNGTWQLIIKDNVGGDAGALIRGSLQFSYNSTLYNPNPATLDNCDNFVDLSHSDVVAVQPCSSPYTSIITRNWVAEDNYGNKSQCSQKIFILKKQLADLVYPPNYDDLDQPALSCTDAYPTPAVTGTIPAGCSNISCNYTDLVIDICQNSYKIVRTWTCLDWCNGVIAKHDQIIKVLDKIAPSITCPKPSDVLVDYYNIGSQYQSCEVHVSLPWVPITDNCSTFNNIDVQVVTKDAKGVLYSAKDPGADNKFEFDLVPGNYIFTYEATDDCGNLGTCTVAVQIKDNEEPVAVCESYHQVSLTDSVTVVNAEAFDDGSYDKCSPITFLARRLDNPKCQGNDATPFGPTVPFYCCDAKGGQDVTVELRAIDADGNFNTCWSVVKVEDKIRPVIVCPADITVWCGAPYTPTNLDTTVIHQDINSYISEVYAHKYQFPLDVEGFPKGSKIFDLDVSLDIEHAYTNQLEVTLFDPYGNKATLFTSNSCPGSYGTNIKATFNDEAFDIAYWNSTYNAQYKSGTKIPADYTCISSKIPSIGTYNTGTVTGTGETYTIGQMRPQADHLKVFDGNPLNNFNSKAFANVQASDIDVNKNRISNFELYNLIDGLGLAPGQKITLRYDAATGGAIDLLEVGSYYIFQIVDPYTIELVADNGTDIVSVPAGSTHKFTWSASWVLQVYDNAPIAGGKVNSVDLHFTWGLPTALKPVVTDNTQECGLMVTWSDLDQPDPCYNNVIRRRWVATDMFTNSRNCIQRISFEDETPLVVQFPCDVTIQCDNAAFNIDEYVAANKPLHSGDCESVGVESIVHELTVVPDACKKYIVKWKVIDWCQYDINSTTNTNTGISLSYNDVTEWFPNLPWHNQCDNFVPGFPFNILAFEDDGDGYFEYTQYIKVLDKIKPVLPCKDTVICSYAACQETVTLNAKATDLCTADQYLKYSYKVDAFNDGTTDISSPANVNSPSFTGTVPFGRHRITWTATDGCGNYTTCSYIFWVKDCKKPTPVCINGLSAPNMPVQKVVTIWATDWESGSSYDNCCAHSDLVHRVIKTKESDHQTPPTSTSVTFDCTEIGSQAVEVWVGDCGYDANGDGSISDDERNWDFCNTFILVTDNDGVCGANPMATLTGTIKTETGVGVNGVDLTVLGTNQSAQTGVDGKYSFNVPTTGNYTVVPSKNINFLNGVNTLDIVYITNHILGKKALDSGYKKIAADINKDKKITTGDLVQLRQLILHITNEFPSNTSWRFVDGAYNFTTNNQMGENFPEVASENNLSVNQINDFVGVKIGDVTNSVNPNAANGGSNESRSSAVLTFSTQEQDLVAGTEYKVNITSKEFRNMLGYQFTMSYDADMLDFVNVDGKALDITGENFGLTNLASGKITTSWNGKSVTSLNDGEVLFTLTFKALKSGKLSKGLHFNSSLTEAMAFNKEDEAMNVNLEFTNGNTVVNEFDLLQNQPNPFKDFTVISFVLPQATSATLKIYDVAGKVLKVVNGEYAKGMNNVKIDRSEIPATGVLYYQLDTDTDSAVKKMIIVE